jgi:hypothetical protein
MRWTEKMDKRLVAGVKAGKSRGQMAIKLGVSRNSAIIRYARIHGRIFPYQEERVRRIAERKVKREAARRAAIAALDRDLKDGKPRLWAFERAIKNGATYQLIGQHLGISRQGVQQYCAFHK